MPVTGDPRGGVFVGSGLYLRILGGSEFSCSSKRGDNGSLVVLSRRNRGRPIRVSCDGGRDDGFYMRRCVELARKGLGFTSPNPMVGCVIVKDGEVVGEGFHPKAGQPHAEVFALKDSGILAEKATAYVSLEPCNHYGRTPPCTEALIRAKVRRVVVGMVDPNPIVASKGVERLREAGIDVTVGVEEMLCQKLNEAYIHRMVTRRPFVTLRYSIAFNGRIFDKLGQGTEEPAGYYSKLMQEYDGVVISSDLLAETSSLPTSHETGANQPLQIIIARSGSSSLSLDSLSRKSSGKVVVLAENTITLEPTFEGIELVVLEPLNLSTILEYLASQGLCSVLLDFRGEVLSKLIEDGIEQHLVQKVVMEVCPIWDATEGSPILAFGGRSSRLQNLQSRPSNESIVVEGYIS